MEVAYPDRTGHCGSAPHRPEHGAGTARRLCLASLILALQSGCDHPAPPRDGAAYMLPQAAGVELGMDWRTLRAARPRVLLDSHQVWESVGSGASNTYLVGRGDGAVGGASTRGVLRAVVMDQVFASTQGAEYQARVSEVADRWTRQTGPTRREVRGGGDRTVNVWSWHDGDLKMMLIFADAGFAGSSSLLRAIVSYADTELPRELVASP